jgi:glycosyltransferase involved in cell wall biosynthesis
VNPTGISIALCTYNGEKYLYEQLESIIGQTVLPDEIVICDDDSTDNTVSIIKKFSSSTVIPIRLYNNEERLGVTRNFKKAISLCNGNYIALCDQDDVWLKNKLEKEIAAFNAPGNENLEVVFTDLLLVDEKLNSLGKTMWQHINFTKKLKREWRQGGALSRLLFTGNVVTGASVLFKSSLRARFLDLLNANYRVWIHDGLIALVAAKQNTITFLDEVTVLYRQHDKQAIGGYASHTTKPRHSDMINEQLEGYTKGREDLLQLGYKKEQLSQLSALIDHFTIRRNLPVNRFKRLPIIVKEFITGRYNKYSGTSIRHPIKDWLG